MSPITKIASCAALLAAVMVSGCTRTPSELVVYSARNEQLIKPMFDRYTAETGQAIRFVTDDAGPLIENSGRPRLCSSGSLRKARTRQRTS